MFRKKVIRIAVCILALSLTNCFIFGANAVSRKISNDKKYIGMYADESTVSSMGMDVNMLGWFDNLYSGPSENKLKLCLDEHRYTAFITLQPKVSSNDDSKPNKNVMKEIAAGKYDDMITSYFTELSKGDRINTELFIRFAHEMEYPKYRWYQWQTSASIYVKAWRHVYNIGHKIAPNVKWVWSPNKAKTISKSYYPGNAYVDYVSVTLNTTQTSKIVYPTLASFYTKKGVKSKLEAYGKPIIFGEVAVNIKNTAARNKYIKSILDYIADKDRYVGFVILNMNVRNGNGYYRPYKFTNNSELKTAFSTKARAILRDITIPSTIEEIDDNAFSGVTFENIYLEDGITSIGDNAFANCGKLEWIRIPQSVQTIGLNAFAGCSSNLEIYGETGSAAEVYAIDNGICFQKEYP